MLVPVGQETDGSTPPPSSRRPIDSPRDRDGSRRAAPDPSKRQGRWTTFYDNGNKRSEGGYLDGEMHGAFCLYYEDGTLREQGQYVRGRAHGRWTKWDARGTCVKEVVFHHGVKVSS